jgi:Tfp pilus assembly protein PilX
LHHRTLIAHERGVVLFVALIVLVAMSLAAIALFRSVDTANLVAGNQAFKQGALNATELGVANALAKFDTTVTGSTLSSDTPTHTDLATSCYKASTFSPAEVDSRGVPKLLVDPTTVQSPFTVKFDTTYANCKFTNSNGEDVRYIIDRQCDSTISGLAASNSHCNVVSTSSPAKTDDDTPTGSESVPLYRVTVRVDGPRHTVSFAQVIFRP